MEETVIQGSRAKSAMLLLVALAFTAVAFSMVQDPDIEGWKAWGGLLFFGLCLIVGVWKFLAPNRLVLGREGFTMHVGRAHFVRWDDVETFHIWRNPAPLSMQKLVAWTYKAGRKPSGQVARMAAGLGAEGSLPSLLAMKPERLVDLMNQRLEAFRK